MTALDQIALSIELVLISVVEAVALTFLAENAAPVLRSPSLLYIPYVVSGLLLILVFWSQSILHAVSFIRWPLRLGHMFLYFVATFVQVIAYTNITDAPRWFFWMSMFSAVGLLLYVLDLQLIRDSRVVFSVYEGGEEFMFEVERRHRYEMHVLVPIALVFNVAAFLSLVIFPAYFAAVWPRALLGIVSAVFSSGALFDCVRNFNERSARIAKLFSV